MAKNVYEEVKKLIGVAFSPEQKVSPSDIPEYKQAEQLLSSTYGYSPEMAHTVQEILSPNFRADVARSQDRFRIYGSQYDVDKYWGGWQQLGEALARGVPTKTIVTPPSEYGKGGQRILVPAEGEPTYAPGQISPSEARERIRRETGKEPTQTQIDALVGKPLTTPTEPLATITPTEPITPSPIESIRQVFGPTWEPSPAFTPELQAKGIYGAVRIKGRPEVYTLGPGGGWESPETFEALFGTLEQKGIVGEVSTEQARQLGIVVKERGIPPTEAVERKELPPHLQDITPPIPEIPGLEEEEEIAVVAPPKTEEEEEAEEEAETIEDKTKKVSDLTLDVQIKELEEQLGITAEPPEPPELFDTFEALRSEKGIPALETRLTQLNKNIRDAEASLRRGLYDEEGKLKPMELIGTAQRELARQGQELLDTLTREKATIIDELATKNSMIENLMNFKQTDFANASTLYNNEFSKQIQLLNIIEGRETREDQQANQIRDDARANLNILMDSLAGQDWTAVSDETKVLINSLSTKAELPAGLIPAIFENTDTTKEKSFHIVSDDDTQVTIFYKDGTSQTFSTGLPAKTKAGDIIKVTFSSEEEQKLIGAGLSTSEIKALRDQINTMGFQAAVEKGDYSGGQLRVIRETFGREVFLDENYFRREYTDAELKAAAKAKGFTKGGFLGFGVGQQGVTDYINDTMNQITELRNQGYSDEDIRISLELRKPS